MMTVLLSCMTSSSGTENCLEQVWHPLEHHACPRSEHEGGFDAIWRRQHISSTPARYREVLQPPNHKGDDWRNPKPTVQLGPASLSAMWWGPEALCHRVKATSRVGCSCKRSRIGWCIPGAVSNLKALPLARPPLYGWRPAPWQWPPGWECLRGHHNPNHKRGWDRRHFERLLVCPNGWTAKYRGWQVHLSALLMAALLSFLWNRRSHRNTSGVATKKPPLCNHLRENRVWKNSFHLGPP